MPPLTSPVYAPASWAERSWAPKPIASLSPVTRVCTLRSAVNGGSTTTSAASSWASFREKTTFWTSPMASRWVICSFQLPAISGRRPSRGARVRSLRAISGPRSIGEHREARELPALEVLQRRAAAGADVAVGLLVEAQLADGGRGVPAPDDGEPVDGGDRRGDPAGARLEGGQFEDAHRAVPEDGPGVSERRAEHLDGAGP